MEEEPHGIIPRLPQVVHQKDVVPTLEALQNMMQFHHQEGIDMLKLGFTSPNIANRIPHSSTSFRFFLFNQEDKSFDDYIRAWLTGGPSIIFTLLYSDRVQSKITKTNQCIFSWWFSLTLEHSFEVFGCYWYFCPCQEKKGLPIDEIESGVKKRE